MNENFVQRAPAEVVEKVQLRRMDALAQREKILQALERLSDK